MEAKKLKPFDLEAAKRGEPVMMRNGSVVEEFRYFEKRSDWRVAVVVNGELYCHRDDGSYSIGRSRDGAPQDLFMAQRKVTLYLNLYHGGSASHWHNEATAKHMATIDALAVAVPVEIEV